MKEKVRRHMQNIEEARDHSLDEFLIEGLDDILNDEEWAFSERVNAAKLLLEKHSDRRNG